MLRKRYKNQWKCKLHIWVSQAVIPPVYLPVFLFFLRQMCPPSQSKHSYVHKFVHFQKFQFCTHSEFCGLRTCQRHAALERNQIYWLRKPLVHKKSERGNLHKTQPKQNKQRRRNWNTGSVHVDSYNEETSKPTTHEKPANAWGNHGTWKQ